MKKYKRILFAAMILLLAGCRSAALDGDDPAVSAAATGSTVEESYGAVLGEYYTAIEQRWDAAALMENGLNSLPAQCYGDMPLENIGYLVTDLCGDGNQELLIASMGEEGFYGCMVFALYQLDDSGVPGLIFDGSEHSRYYYAGENRFANLGDGAFGERFETTVKLEDGEMIDMTYTTDPADYVLLPLTPFSQWGN